VVRRILIGALAATAVAVAALTSASAATLRGTLVEDSFSSRAVAGRLRLTVYLPPGYVDGTRRYPVIYFLHGLPASASAHRDIAYVGRALEAGQLQAIVVSPQGARDGDPDPEYLDWGPGRNWETAVSAELPRVVDSRYRTIANRGGRALVGVSAGGYGATVIGLHHLGAFSVIESWSGYFHPTDPSGTQPLPRGSDLDDALASAHTFVPQLRTVLAQEPTFLGFYVGDRDTTFLAENERLARELSRAHVPFTFEVYRGGHSRSLWEGEALVWLTLAVGHLAQAA
jgi:enterochelin esterase-like enzyme